MGVEMLSLKNKRPRCVHRGLLPTGNPQSANLLDDIIRKYCPIATPLRLEQFKLVAGGSPKFA